MMTYSANFFVPGDPKPKGSWKIMPRRGTVSTPGLGFAPTYRIKDLCLVSQIKGLRQWERAICALARVHAPPKPLTGAVEVDLAFYLPRPKTVTRQYPTKVPDEDKLVRAVRDALKKGGIYSDDCQVIGGRNGKRYVTDGYLCGVHIAITAMEQEQE